MNSTHLGKGEVRVVLMALEAQVAFVSQEAWDLTIREKRSVKGMFNQTVFKITETLIDIQQNRGRCYFESYSRNRPANFRISRPSATSELHKCKGCDVPGPILAAPAA